MIMSVSLRPDTKDKLRVKAGKYETSMSELMREYLEESYYQEYPVTEFDTKGDGFYSDKVCFYLDESWHKAYMHESKKFDISFSEYARRALEAFL